MLIVPVGIVVFFLCALPLISAELSGGEGCTLIVRGFNLVEFSSWGIIPILSPLLILAILLSHQPKPLHEAEILMLLATDAVCYVHSFNAAYAWLDSIQDTRIVLHSGMLLYPLGFLVILGLSGAIDLWKNHRKDAIQI